MMRCLAHITNLNLDLVIIDKTKKTDTKRTGEALLEYPEGRSLDLPSFLKNFTEINHLRRFPIKHFKNLL